MMSLQTPTRLFILKTITCFFPHIAGSANIAENAQYHRLFSKKNFWRYWPPLYESLGQP